MKENEMALGKSDIGWLCKTQKTFREMYYADGDGVIGISEDHVQLKEAVAYAKFLDVLYMIILRGCDKYPYEVQFNYDDTTFLAVYSLDEILNFVSEDELPTL
jgi:hypothetical protein